MSKAIKMSAEELKWRAEDDARILTEYAKITGDKERYKRAKKVLEQRKNDIIKVLKSKGV